MNRPPTYHEVAPPAVLRPFVECLWVHDIDGPAPEGGRRLLPDGRVSLVWIPDRSLHVAGPQTRFMRPAPVEGMRVLGARFRPGAIRSLLHVPAAEIVDEHVPLDAVDSRLAARLDARLGDARDIRAALETFARRAHAHRSSTGRRPIRRSARPCGCSIVPTRRSRARPTHVYLSERALQRRFTEEVGYGPKMLQRVLRFQRFLRHVPETELAGAAALAGYADQSHLTREATRLAGLTPLQLRTYQH